MAYLILLMTITLVLAVIVHLKQQHQKTASVREDLRKARATKELTGLHSLRNKK